MIKCPAPTFGSAAPTFSSKILARASPLRRLPVHFHLPLVVVSETSHHRSFPSLIIINSREKKNHLRCSEACLIVRHYSPSLFHSLFLDTISTFGKCASRGSFEFRHETRHSHVASFLLSLQVCLVTMASNESAEQQGTHLQEQVTNLQEQVTNLRERVIYLQEQVNQ